MLMMLMLMMMIIMMDSQCYNDHYHLFCHLFSVLS